MISSKIRVLAPAGSFSSLSAALSAGADAVYLGVGELNMRSLGANNFTVEDLPQIVQICHQQGVEAYLTANVIVYDSERIDLQRLCDSAKQAGIDAIIAADPAVIMYACSIGLSVHLSVQCNISNIDSLKFYSQYADVAVLARELTLPQITAIANQVSEDAILGRSGKRMELELFVHGAMCVAVSGKCYMSLAQNPLASANRGSCHQPCRRKYLLQDTSNQSEFELDGKYVMSPRDLCTLRVLPELLKSGVSILKIEGRARSADYVYTTVKIYKDAVRAIVQNGTLSDGEINHGMTELAKVFNRGFWEGGYYLGEPMGEWTTQGGSLAQEEKVFVGKVTRYLSKIGVAEVLLEAAGVARGMTVMIIGDTTGCVRTLVESLHGDNGATDNAPIGTLATFQVAQKVRTGDKVYLLRPRVFGQKVQENT